MGLDQDALLRLLLARRGMLIGYIMSIVRDAHLAEDIFQNVALLVVKKGSQLDREEGFSSWVRKIARYESLNAIRKQKHAPVVLDETMLESLEEHWRAADEGTQPVAVDALNDCLRRLTPRARRLVELRYRDNVSGKRLAELLERPLNTVYVALSRIHRALAQCVKYRLSKENSVRG